MFNGVTLGRAGTGILRWGTVVVLVWFGAFKFAPSEAAAIRPLVENSPLMVWMYAILSERAVSIVIGLVELAAAFAMATRPWLPRVSFYGSLAAAGIFAITTSFLLTTPGTFAVPADFPLPVPAGAGGFLFKDIFLLAGALVVAREAFVASSAVSIAGSRSSLSAAA